MRRDGGVLRVTETVERDPTRGRPFWAPLTYGWRVSWALTCPVAPKETVTLPSFHVPHAPKGHPRYNDIPGCFQIHAWSSDLSAEREALRADCLLDASTWRSQRVLSLGRWRWGLRWEERTKLSWEEEGSAEE